MGIWQGTELREREIVVPSIWREINRPQPVSAHVNTCLHRNHSFLSAHPNLFAVFSSPTLRKEGEMDLFVKAETERLTSAERSKRRQLRIAQVRQQTSDWMNKSREDYKAERDRQIKILSDSVIVDAQSLAVDYITYHSEAHTLAMNEIGTAHGAAAAARKSDSRSAQAAKKIMDDARAKIRHGAAIKEIRCTATSLNVQAEEPILRRKQVRFEEDIKAKELVEKLPFGVRNGDPNKQKEVGRKRSEYQQGLVKLLYIPSKPCEKENFVAVGKKKTQARKASPPSKPKEGVFSKLADVRQGGAGTPDLARMIPSRDLPAFKRQKQVPDVTFYDASLPQPPQKYRPPMGLVERVAKQDATAWTGAKRATREMLETKLRRSLDAIEKQKKTEERGKTALKIAKLEQEFKQLEVEFAHGDELLIRRPVMISPDRVSLVEFGDHKILSESVDHDKIDLAETVEHGMVDSAKLPQSIVQPSESSESSYPVDDHLLVNMPSARRQIGSMIGSTSSRAYKPSSKPLSLSPQETRPVVLLEGPTYVQHMSESDHEILQDSAKENKSPATKKFEPISYTVTAPSRELSSSSDLTTSIPSLGSEYHNVDSSLSSSNGHSFTRKSASITETRRLEVYNSEGRAAYSVISCSGSTVTENSQNRVRVSTSEISSLPLSSKEEYSSGTDYYNLPGNDTDDLRMTPQLTSTPDTKSSKCTSYSKSAIFKCYIKKLLERRPESIDAFSSPSDSSCTSYVLMNSSATISGSSHSTSSSQCNSTAHNDVRRRSRSYDQVDNLMPSFIQTSHEASHLLQQSTTTTTSDNSTSSTNAIVNIKFTPTHNQSSSISTSNTDTDQSLICALTALSTRQSKVVSSSSINESNSSQYYSADEQNASSTSIGVECQDQMIAGSILHRPPNSPSTGSSDAESKEARRAGTDACASSRPSSDCPDLEISLENNPFQQLASEWINISIERPDWLTSEG